MARLRPERPGSLLTSNGKIIPFSFWPAKRSTRWALQRRLYVKDPWATLFEAVYRSEIPKARIQEALSYLDQAEEYFKAGTQVGGRMSVKPLLLYYSVLNLSKCILAVRKPGMHLSNARHGLSATRPHPRALLGDQIGIKTSSVQVNVFNELMSLLDGRTLAFRDLEVRHLLAQILPAHRLWTYASGRKEQFISIDILPLHDDVALEAWLTLSIDKGEITYMGQSIRDFLRSAGLPGQWQQVHSDTPSHIALEQSASIRYTGRPLDCVNQLFGSLRSSIWSVVTTTYPHRKYYLNCDPHLGRYRLPQWASTYVFFYYLSDLTRYRPVHFDRFIESKYGPQVESILDECPQQFLFLMASELLEREVAPADLA